MIYIGEITLYPEAGLNQFNPDVWNYNLGKLINLKFCSNKKWRDKND